ncbi:S8 family serine peptidase [Metabacillus sp. RGM 3146]|uniref:S8 family serine peptidase n=1 Tax=Metabacillus sp. RGM 3146 TaxID=3401092 RepID=UPI003B99D5D6
MKKAVNKAFSVAVMVAMTLSIPMAKAETAGLKKADLKASLLQRLGVHEKQKAKVNMLEKDNQEKFDKKTLIVKYKTPLSLQVHQKAGTKLLKRITGLNYDVVQINGKQKLEDAAGIYMKTPGVLSVSRSAKFYQQGMPDMKARDQYQLKTLHADEAQKLAGNGKVRVAVVDTGIDAKHPELKNKVVSNYNVMNPIQKGAADVHGTHVAGIIAAKKDNGIGGYGINPNASILSIDVFNRSFFANDYTVAQGILKAIDEKAQVINMSLGSSVSSPIIEDAVKKALKANITIVAATGNSGTAESGYPASYEGVIGVGSTNSKNELSYYSTYGPSVDLVAPGEDVYSSIYDYQKGSSFAKLSGTSMASPMVAGVASLLISKNPKLTPYEVNYILNKTAKDLGDKGYDLKYGHGLVDPVAALKFDPRKIPQTIAIPEDQLLQKSVKLVDEPSLTVAGSFTNMNQHDAYKINVKKGENIQTKLTGSKNYDYELELKFYPAGKSKSSISRAINDRTDDGKEGGLFEAKEDGVLVAVVRDVYGNASEDRASNYTLNLIRSEKKMDDENTSLDDAEAIPAVPYKTEKPFYFTEPEQGTGDVPANGDGTDTTGDGSDQSNRGDSDFFKLKTGDVKDGEVMKVSVNGVPGVNSRLVLWQTIKDQDGVVIQGELDSADYNNVGDGEQLTFNALPNTEYFVEVTSKPAFDPWQFMLTGSTGVDKDRSYSSLLPYELTVDSKVLPADEDNFPQASSTPEDALKQGDITGYQARKTAIEKKSAVIISDSQPEEEWTPERIKSIALPYKEGEQKDGYLQYMGDSDWYAFTPQKSELLKFSLSGVTIPVAQLLVYDDKTNDFGFVAINIQQDRYSVSTSSEFTAGLQAGKTYYLNIGDLYGRVQSDPYSLSTKIIASDISDKHESNDNFDQAKPIGTSPVTGTFSTSMDLDFFYFKPKQQGIYGLELAPGGKPDAKYSRLSKDFLQPFDGMMIAVEDTNGNGKLDDEEQGNAVITDNTLQNEAESGSIEVNHGKGFFIGVANYYPTPTLMPYKLSITPANQKDEDAGSVTKGNVPTKPVLLKKGKAGWSANGLFNPDYKNQDDQDYYKLVLDKNSKLTISLGTGVDTDGAVTIYDAKGKQLVRADQYGLNDKEMLNASLKKGTYYIKVEEADGRASLTPYELTIK